MANENLVSGLFGMTPWQVQQQQQAGLNAAATQHANMDPFARASAGIYRAGGQLGGMLAENTGGVNPDVAKAQQSQQALQGLDLRTPDGLRAAAERFQSLGMQQQAMLAAAKANEIEAGAQDVALKAAREERELAMAEKALRDPTQTPSYQEVGVAGRPEWRQKVQVFPDGSTTNVGEPYKSGSGISADARANAIRPTSVRDEWAVNKARDAAMAASQSGDLLRQYKEVLDQYAGNVGAGETAIGTTARYLASAGVGTKNFKDRAADFENLRSWSEKLGAMDLSMFGGSDTERELLVAIRTNPNPNTTVVAQDRILRQKLAAVEVLSARPQFMEEWIANNGSTYQRDKETGKTFTDAWRSFQSEQYKKALDSYIPGSSKKPTTAPTSGAWSIRKK